MKPFPGKVLTYSICGLLAAAAFLSLISSLWQHVAAVAFTTTIEKMAYGSVKSEVGAGAIGFGWVSLALYIVAFCAVLTMILAIRVYDRLTDRNELEAA